MAWRDYLDKGRKAASDAGFNRHFFDAGVTRNTFQQFPQAAQKNAVSRYAQNQIVEPIARGIAEYQVKRDMGRNTALNTLTDSVAPIAQGAFNATPAAVVGNALTGAATAAAKAIREKSLRNAFQDFSRMSTQPTSFAQEGLNVQNPYAAAAIDVVTGNPRGSLAGVANLKNLSLAAGTARNLATVGKSAALVAGFKTPETGVLDDLKTVAGGIKATGKGAWTYAETLANQKGYARGAALLGAEIPQVPVTAKGQPILQNGVPLMEPAPTAEVRMPLREGARALKKGVVDFVPINTPGALDNGSVTFQVEPRTGKIVSAATDSPALEAKFKQAAKAPLLKEPDYSEYAPLKGQDFGGDVSDLSLEGAQFRSRAESARERSLSRKGSAGKPLQEKLVDNNETLNVNRLNVTPEAKLQASELIDANKKAITRGPGAKLTNKEVIEAAGQTDATLTKVVGREQTKRFEAALLNTRQLLAKQAQEGRVTPEYLENLAVLKSFASDTARKLQSFGIDADPKEITAMQRIVSEVMKVTGDADEILKAAEGVDFNDAKQAAEFYRRFVKPKASDWLDLLRYNSMLSSPNTHINNAASNLAGSSLVKPVEKSLAGAVDFVGSALTGRERKAFAGEGPAYAKGYWGSVGKAYKAFSDTMAGKSLNTNLDTRSIPLATKGPFQGVFGALNYPMKMLEASDQFFTALAEGGETAALNLRASKGARVGDIAKQASENAAYTLYRQDLGSSQQGHVLDAIDRLTANLQALRSSENPLVATAAKFTVPFLKTPMNIFKQGLEYSPAGFATLPGAKNKEEQIAKAVIGSAVFGGAVALLGSGRITWAEPTSEPDRTAFRAAGRQAYSVKVGNTWVAYSKLPPAIAFPFAMVAAIDDAQKNGKLDESTTEQVLAGISKYGQFLSDQSYAKSIGDLLSASDTDSGWARVAGNNLQQLFPYRALGGWLARLADDTQRKVATDASFVEKQVQQLMLNIPGLSDDVPARLDGEGNPIPNRNNVANAFSPVRLSTEDPVLGAQYRAQEEKGRLDRTAAQEVEKMKAGTPGKEADIPALLAASKASASGGKSPSAGGESAASLGVRRLANGTFAYTDGNGDVKTARTEDAARLGAAKAAVANGDSDKVDLGDRWVVAADNDSGYRVVKKADAERKAKEARRALDSQRAKASGDYQAWEKLQKEYYDDLSAQLRSLDPEVDADKLVALQDKREDILATVAKYRSYGGAFAKPKAPKKGGKRRGSASLVRLP
jgi:hypothetical protein